MTSVKAVVAIVAVLGLSACGDDPFGKNKGGSDGITQSNLDPHSIAYFNETIGDTVLFDVDQSTLNEAGIALLNQQAEWLLEHPVNSVLIEGHADEQGTREYNLALGARRAAAVQSYLVSRGLTDARLRTITYGKERPLEICSDEACWSKNRRSVTVVTGGLGS
ncbi:peptidoglycan-associated lipoprotein [Amylibacter marinus]|uniref:Peptidoglycan-associated lipoprotein n=1 Tax=Amylibacter marinus TaxID=1475483 RepID=A0ABQ5VRP2_9RHOB|nr:peptidoglycan-associated lipoprotein Pal [Amylibacter marinus]GLQ33782.1 peptidoglycan-associated lipoprotein [Amylibacter marinus]